jgi:hypothetical protein
MTWLTSKIQAGDVPILLKLGAGAKVNDYLQVVYRKVRGVGRGQVAAEIPKGAGQLDWKARKLIGMGLKLGGKKMFTPTGRAVFKGLNVFPGRLRGEPMGLWDGTVQPLEIRTYKYDRLFINERLFVARAISAPDNRTSARQRGLQQHCQPDPAAQAVPAERLGAIASGNVCSGDVLALDDH